MTVSLPMRVLRDPFFYFLLIGGALFVGYTTFGAGSRQAEPALVIDDAELRALALSWQARTGMLPSAAELDVLLDAHVQDRVMMAAALERGLHLTDPMIRERLIESLLNVWAVEAASVEPTADQLRARYQGDPDRYREPMELTITHRFYDARVHGAAARPVAERALVALNTGQRVPDDPYPDAKTVTVRNHTGLAESFGVQFADAVLDLAERGAVGVWAGPVRSEAGWHAVRIDRYTLARTLSFDEAMPRLRREWQRDHVAQDREGRLAALRAEQQVRVTDADALLELLAAP